MGRKRKRSTRSLAHGEGFILERVSPRGRATYQARWIEGHGIDAVHRGKTFASRDEAEDFLRTIARGKRDGTYTPENTLTIGELITEYLDHGRHRWSTNTHASYELLARKWITPRIGTQRVVSATPRILQRWIDGLVRKGLSASHITNCRIVLSGAFREAVQMDIVSTNPAASVRIPKRKRTTISTWSIEEVRAALAMVRDDAERYALYMVALTTGMRPGELRALKWSDLDAGNMVITVQRSMTRGEKFRAYVGDDTKTGRSRAIAIPEATVRALTIHRRQQNVMRLQHPHWHDDNLIFTRPDGRFLPLTTLARWHRAVCDGAGIQRIRLHDLRHTYATIELESGTHPKVVSERLGHSSITMTLDRYSHVSADLQRAAAEAIAQRLLPDELAQDAAQETE